MGYRMTFKQGANNPFHKRAEYRLRNLITFKLTTSLLQKQPLRRGKKKPQSWRSYLINIIIKRLLVSILYKDTYKSTRGSNIIKKMSNRYV